MLKSGEFRRLAADSHKSSKVLEKNPEVKIQSKAQEK